MNKSNSSRRIQILRDSVARRIAAGEVIDRPQAVIRELLDNSIDAGSSEISLYIREGGMDEIRVVDNGSGMDRENLEKCFLPHATSKITDFEDIYSTRTLGFRGEALSSIAACSKLSIISCDDPTSPANKLEIRDGRLTNLSESRGAPGTVISVKDLFYSMPGRKNFLKSPAAEAAQCRSMFIEKAAAQPDITFRYFSDDKLKLFLPASGMLERIRDSYAGLLQNELLRDFNLESDDIGVSAVLGTPSLYRKDRKYIHVFINNRRISDYSLVQAVDYAYSSYLPGGCHPVCFLFLQVPPEHVDFNIHPAKREVKFRNLPNVHHTVTEAVGRFLSGVNSFKASALSPPPSSQQKMDFGRPAEKPPARSAEKSGSGLQPGTEKQASYRTPPAVNPAADSIFRTSDLDSIAAELEPQIPESRNSAGMNREIIYLGQIFSLFLVFEHGDDLLLIDQHAAHERIIFNSLSEKKPAVQELLVPLSLSLEKDEEISLERNLPDYSELGFDLQKASPGEWLINSLPSVCAGIEDSITALFKNGLCGTEALKKELFAMISCRKAIKDGDRIDSISALEIAGKVLEMENPRCPHGRPVIQQISRDQLFKMFGRTF